MVVSSESSRMGLEIRRSSTQYKRDPLPTGECYPCSLRATESKLAGKLYEHLDLSTQRQRDRYWESECRGMQKKMSFRYSTVNSLHFLKRQYGCMDQGLISELAGPGCSLEGLMLKLKLQYFGHLMRRVGKDADGGRDWGQEEKGTTEDEMAGWHHQLDGQGFR